MASSISPSKLTASRRVRLRLAPGVPGLGALGTRDTGAWFGERALDGERDPVLGAAILEGGGVRRRFPLPGTPRELGGPPVGRPRGAGTGWCLVERWCGAPLGASLRGRFTRPPSASLAERRWNLLCHLRAAGVGTPEPLCVGARGQGIVSRDSFLVTREPRGFVPLDLWLAAQRSPEERALGIESLAASLALLLEAGVILPHVQPGHLAVAPVSRDCGEPPGAGGQSLHRLPSVILLETPGARIVGRPDEAGAVRMLGSLLAPALALRPLEHESLLDRTLASLPSERAARLRKLLDRNRS